MCLFPLFIGSSSRVAADLSVGSVWALFVAPNIRGVLISMELGRSRAMNVPTDETFCICDLS